MDKRLFYLLLFLAATGFTAGVFFEIHITGDGKTQLMDLLTVFFTAEDSSLSIAASVLQNFCSGLPFLLLCFLLSRFPIVLFFFVVLLFLQSLLYGISAALLMETFGLPQGIFHVLTAAAPGALLRTLLFVYFAVTAMELPVHRPGRSGQSRKKALRMFTGPVLKQYTAGAAVLLLISLLQAYLQQLML